MLSIRIATSGEAARIRRVASRPFVFGISQSITMTRGLRVRASSMASAPSLASPTTMMAGSSARRTVIVTSILSGTRLHLTNDGLVVDWYNEPVRARMRDHGLYPATASARDRFVLERRGPRPEHDPRRYQGLLAG